MNIPRETLAKSSSKTPPPTHHLVTVGGDPETKFLFF